MAVLLAAYLLLGNGLLIADGTLPGLPYAVAAFALVLFAPARWRRSSPRLLPWFVVVAAALVLRRTPAHGWVDTVVIVLTVIQGLIGIAPWVLPRLSARTALAAAIALYASTGALLITCAPAPRIDVYELQQGGASALERAQNPYAALYPNLYTPEETRRFFGDERTELREYPYPPGSLVATTLGHLLGGDVRWPLLGAQLGVAGLLWALARAVGHAEPTALALATIHLLHPRGLFVLENAWTEPLLACAFLVLLLLIRKRSYRWLGLALGLFVSAKQYSLLALPLLLRDGRLPRRAWAQGLLTASVLALPFFLWGPRDFLNDVVMFQLRQPFRADAMSLPAYVAHATGWRAPGVLALAGVALGAAYGWRKVGPDAAPSVLPLAVALLYAGFFLFAKQAFCNYYYFVGVLLVGAAALVDPAPDAAIGAQSTPSLPR